VLELLRSEAKCYFFDNELNLAIRKLKNILVDHPNDEATINLLNQVEEAKKSGEKLDSRTNPFRVNNEPLIKLYNITPIAEKLINNCTYRGLDDRDIIDRKFTKQSIRSVKNILENLKGRRPRDRSDYQLTLVKVYHENPDLEENKKIKFLTLRWCFNGYALAESSELGNLDVVRTYCIEGLLIKLLPNDHGNDFENEKDDQQNSVAILLATYIKGKEIVDGFNLHAKGALPNVLKRLQTESDALIELQKHIPFYLSKIPDAIDLLRDFINENGFSIELPSHEKAKIDQIQRCWDLNENLDFEKFTTHNLKKMSETCKKLLGNLPFELDGNRLEQFIYTLDGLSEYIIAREFGSKENLYLKISQLLKDLEKEWEKNPTHFSYEVLFSCVKELHKTLEKDFSNISSEAPSLELKNILEGDFYSLEDTGFISLRLTLLSKDVSRPPIESISLHWLDNEYKPCHWEGVLNGGQSKEFELKIKPKLVNKDDALDITITIEYKNNNGAKTLAQSFLIAVRLSDRQNFKEINNPYVQYAGGNPIVNYEMFFGRSNLLNKIINNCTNSIGHCFVLYGQKRSGKSSVLNKVENIISQNNKVIFVKFTVGSIADHEIFKSFTNKFLIELNYKLEDIKLSNIFIEMENKSLVEPFDKIRYITRLLNKKGFVVVMAIDEFTYIYEKENFQEKLNFMRNWKALLEIGSFNAIIIGQDTMPRFKNDYPNEFGMTHDERLTYLTEEETYDLATRPIMLDGKSRYRGGSLKRLFDLTAGSPFFLQIILSKLVIHLNAKTSPYVTEADIESIEKKLTIGSEAITKDKFDPLITAAGKSANIVDPQIILKILHRISTVSDDSKVITIDNIKDINNWEHAIEDLTEREVIYNVNGALKIRVKLFALWLKNNH